MAEFVFVHVGRDLEEQRELLECLLAFFLQYLLADDSITNLLCGMHSLCGNADALCKACDSLQPILDCNLSKTLAR